MRKLAAIAGIAAAGLGIQANAYGYSTTANLTFSWATGGSDKAWTSSGVNTLGVMTNATYFTAQTGNNAVGYYNADFATVAQCQAATPVGTFYQATRKYGCRYNSASDFSGSPTFASTPVVDSSGGASAVGNVTVTDTTMTGTLTILATTDEATGGTASSVGNGTTGYNLRSADGSPFGNSWSGVTTLGTYTLNLTGTFNASSWNITGGSAYFSDAGFLCQQGGFSSPNNILCNPSGAAGGFSVSGGALSWGWDVDGSDPGTTATGIQVKDATGANVITTLSGVLASLAVDGSGNVTTNSGEIRRALAGSVTGVTNCGEGPDFDHIRWDGTKISCGTLTTANLIVTGTTAVVPAPAAVWLLGTGIAALVARRRFKKAA